MDYDSIYLSPYIDSQNALSSTTTTLSSSSVDEDFQQILMLMLLNFGSGLSTSDSSDLTSLIMLPLLEQLIDRLSESEAQPAAPSGMPIAGYLTQRYHDNHHGLDFGAPVGTPVQATMGGRVVYAGWNDQGYGNLVIVENGSYRTYYAHLSEIPVQVNQVVQAGMIIGLSGNTGNSTGPHLHYEVRFNGNPIDPTPFTIPWLDSA
jgi:murein DD-endopeptidase MepM/ murein hydrolase activator NlpD